MKLLFTILLSVISFSSFSAPKSELWAYWNLSDEANSNQISHSEWQNFLENYLVTQGENALVRYADVSKDDHQTLKSYIKNLSSLNPLAHNKAEQYAYWVNLYNAVTVDLILDNYPIKSITKLGGLFSFGPWGEEIVTVNGKELSLNDIEHRILRPIWNDPRSHYAVNCASLGCPNLQAEAFTSKNTQTLLEQAAKDFINSSKGVSLGKNSTQLSSIYDWFIADFGTQTELVEHLGKYRNDLPASLGKIKYDYDWSLNELKE
ncbi:DUF547 domain-containing protein [Vibrio hannami]|uniref:DUF547 domain-containing protein n=1 Tax=Vibrio hannami TaxID=2717094 RepID=UPI00240F7AB3|nr:DUF547 domain-containing protein [Vibrio hannami]MDG3087068.1 DUF547 domain-containing protein [Vibrio hannami]